MKFSLEPKLFKTIKEITKKNPKLSKKVQKQLKFFSTDPKHPSLKTHKLKGGLSARWSISIEGNIRIIYQVTNNHIFILRIGFRKEDTYKF